MKHFYFILFVFLGLLAHGQRLDGLVLDMDSGEELPFVSILYNGTKNLGTTTDAFGKFSIPDRTQIERLEVSFIGYRPVAIDKDILPDKGPLVIKLKSLSTELEEATVLPGENPALRIIRNAIKNADKNDPKKYNSYRFKSYMKNVLTKNLDSVISAKKQLGLMESDTARTAIDKYLMISESVGISKYKQPDFFDEEIIGTQISGFKNSIYAVGAENIQYFGLYDDVMQVITEYYLTPLAKGADDKYFYILQDTIVRTPDTTYIMYYQPKRGSNFEGLKGEIHINTDGWAMEYVYAEPLYKGNVDFAIEHEYQQVDGQYWFPKRLNILLQLERLPLFNSPGFVYSKLYVDSVLINPPLSDEEFDHVKRELSEEAPYVDEEFWETYRPEDLNIKEVKTYAHMDSIGEKYKFDFFMNAARNIYHGYLTFGPVELKVNKFLRYTGHEGLRIGAGVYTSPRYAKILKLPDFFDDLRFGGYYGYGLKDQALKYGGTFEYFFNRKDDHKISFNYSTDVMQPGRILLPYYYNTGFWNSVFVNHMDRIEEYSLFYKTRLANFMTLEVGLRDFNITANNNYRFQQSADSDPVGIGHFKFTEAQLKWRWAYKEKITSNFGQQISAGTEYPVFIMEYSKGITDFLNGNYDYNKVELGMWLYRYIKGWGFLDFRLEGGYVDRPVPIQLLFSNRASYSRAFAIVSPNTFQTMRFNEFFSNKYASLFVNHNFGPLLFRLPRFSPEIELYHAMSFGTMQQKERHQNFDFKTLEEGYYESGIVIANILHISFFKVGYMGFGAGVFYRYGPYHLPEESNNWAAKLSIIYTIN